MRAHTGWIAVSLVVVALLAAAYWFSRPATQGPAPATELGLGWLPSESSVVASVHVNELREQAWLAELLGQAAPVEQEPDYREFIAATGFDYARDLDRLWLAVVPTESGGELMGIAQGRFEQAKIVAYARQQEAQQVSLAGVVAYVVERAEPRRRFAFAFLDQKQLAFAETQGGIENILACVRKAAPSIASDPHRRAQLEQFAAGMQAWVIDADVARWPPPGLDRRPDLAAQVRQLGLAVRAIPEGIELVAEGQTQESGQALRLKLAFEAYGLAARVLLARHDDPTSLALREALSGARLNQEGAWLTLRVRLSRAAVVTLLAADVASLAAQPGLSPQQTEKKRK